MHLRATGRGEPKKGMNSGTISRPARMFTRAMCLVNMKWRAMAHCQRGAANMTTMGLWWRATWSVAVPLLVRTKSAQRMMASAWPTRMSTGELAKRRWWRICQARSSEGAATTKATRGKRPFISERMASMGGRLASISARRLPGKTATLGEASGGRAAGEGRFEAGGVGVGGVGGGVEHGVADVDGLDAAFPEIFFLEGQDAAEGVDAGAGFF